MPTNDHEHPLPSTSDSGTLLLVTDPVKDSKGLCVSLANWRGNTGSVSSCFTWSIQSTFHRCPMGRWLFSIGWKSWLAA